MGEFCLCWKCCCSGAGSATPQRVCVVHWVSSTAHLESGVYLGRCSLCSAEGDTEQGEGASASGVQWDSLGRCWLCRAVRPLPPWCSWNSDRFCRKGHSSSKEVRFVTGWAAGIIQAEEYTSWQEQHPQSWLLHESLHSALLSLPQLCDHGICWLKLPRKISFCYLMQNLRG